MKKLGEKNYALLTLAIKTTGSYDPAETMYICEEQMYVHEIDTITKFMQWCHDNNKGFGHGNYEKVFSEFIEANPPHGNLSLKKVKIHFDMSEETTCYSADLYEDGKLMAHVSNEGRGGNDRFTPAGKKVYKDIAHLENPNVEFEIQELLSDYDVTKRYQSKALVLKKGNEYSTIGFKTSIAQIKKNPNQLHQLNEIVKREKRKGYTILNTNI